MGFEPDRVAVVTFDSFSTLVDPRSAATALSGYVDDPEAVARRWHPLAVQYSMVANHVDAYRTYYELHRDAIEHLLAVRGVEVSGAELDEITDVYHRLEPFDDVGDGLAGLNEAGYRLAILSNGDPALLASLLSVTRTGDAIDLTVSADEIRTFKPARELYEHAAERVGEPVERVAHVGAGWMDVQGCRHAGMQGVWLDRRGTPWPPFGGEPDLTVGSLYELAEALGQA